MLINISLHIVSQFPAMVEQDDDNKKLMAGFVAQEAQTEGEVVQEVGRRTRQQQQRDGAAHVVELPHGASVFVPLVPKSEQQLVSSLQSIRCVYTIMILLCASISPTCKK